MFGNKRSKQSRLKTISALVRGATRGISRSQLAQTLNVSRGTITKDLGIVEKATGSMFYEDDDLLFYYADDEGYDD